MEYPIIALPSLSGGLFIALVAVVHVFVAHFAVGGGLFLPIVEAKAYRENSPVILEYVKKHTKFFLLLTMVFGGLTGVGIWFTIATFSPGPTLVLIHTFTFGWAIEWVFFLAEIVALLVYFYTFDKMDRRTHQIIGWLYFVFAWLSLFMITGIIGFMLTPGEWTETRNFWDGFFNPSFLSSVVFRTFLAAVLAGLFGFVTATRIKDEEVRKIMIRYTAGWAVLPVILLIASGFWYLNALPEAQEAMVRFKSSEMPPLMRIFLYSSAFIVLGGLAMAFLAPTKIRQPLAYALLILGLLQIGSFEWIREAGRRPYVIHDYYYSNTLKKEQVDQVNKTGMLASAKWIVNKELGPNNQNEAGRDLFNIQCLPCHSIDGPMLNIRPRTAKFTTIGMDSQLDGQGKLREYMPPFVGTRQERLALSSYIVKDIHGKQEQETAYTPPELPTTIPEFDGDSAEYVLLAWNNLGMHCISDSDPYWVLLPPANDLYVQLVYRDMLPMVVTEGVTITYKVEQGFENPSKHVRFWEFAQSLFGATPPKNVGLSGNGLAGEMKLEEDLNAFSANLIPVVPYPDSGGYNPYPIFIIEAKDAETGEVLAHTRCVAPTSTEMGCKNCHGGEWRVPEKNGVAGFSDATSADVLAVHDRINKTGLLAQAEAGKPMLCQSCHADPVLGTEGKPGIPNFPAAIHGWHANYLTDRGAEACAMCHPNNPKGATMCLRGLHATAGLDCTDCHGYLEDHALSLVKYEVDNGVTAAEDLMAHLQPRKVDSVSDVKGRVPWLMEPDCNSCHDYETTPNAKTASAFNKWTDGTPHNLYRLRRDDMSSIMCEGCHGSTHANYPAVNAYGKNRDNIPPMQYQGSPGTIGGQGNCKVCHTMEMDFPAHHPIPGM